jgi:hypothetical protein
MRGRWVRSTGLVLCLLVFIGGCGDDDDGGSSGAAAGDDRAASQALKQAVAKTEAARTARMNFEISAIADRTETVTAEGVADFEHDRDLITVTFDGQTLQLFSDGGEEYFREGDSDRFRRFPAAAASPVANNPADSLKYLGTDVVDVRNAAEDGCYEGNLDFDRVFARAEPDREDEFPPQLRGQKAPVTVCVDDAGRIRRYDVELSMEPISIEVRTTLSDHGRAPSLERLGPEERPP